LRQYEKIARILTLLKPSILMLDEEDFDENQEIKAKQQKELKELA